MVKDFNNFIRIYYMKAQSKSKNRRSQGKKQSKKLKIERHNQKAGSRKPIELDSSFTELDSLLKRDIQQKIPESLDLSEFLEKNRTQQYNLWNKLKSRIDAPTILAAYHLSDKTDLEDKKRDEVITYLNKNKNTATYLIKLTTELKGQPKKKITTLVQKENDANANENNLGVANVEADCGDAIADQQAEVARQEEELRSLNEKIKNFAKSGEEGLQTIQKLEQISNGLKAIFNNMSQIILQNSSSLSAMNSEVSLPGQGSAPAPASRSTSSTSSRSTSSTSSRSTSSTSESPPPPGKAPPPPKKTTPPPKQATAALKGIKTEYVEELIGGAQPYFEQAKGCDDLNKTNCKSDSDSEPQFWDAKPAFAEINKLQDSDQKKRLMTSLLAASMGNLSYFSSPNLEDINELLKNDFTNPDESGLSPQRQIAAPPGSKAKAQQKSIYKNQLLDFETYTKLSKKAKEKLNAIEINKFIKNCFKYGLFLRICYFVYMYSLLIKELDAMKETDGYQLPYSNKYFFKNTIESYSKFNILIIENNKIKMLEVDPPSGSADVKVKISYGTSDKEDTFPNQIRDNFFYPICMLIDYLQLLQNNVDNDYLQGEESKMKDEYRFLVDLKALRFIRKTIFNAFDDAVVKNNSSGDASKQPQNYKTSVFFNELTGSTDTNISKLNTLAEGLKGEVKSDSDQEQGNKLSTKETYVGLAKDMGKLQALFSEVPELPA
jgi:uncharacterized coiled-coil protein SlyX